MSARLQFVLIGHPVSHSISPAIHRAAYHAVGMGHQYDAVDCADEAAVQRQVHRIRAGEVAGANVTVPHKLLALSLADAVDASARQVGAANVLLRDEGGSVVAYNTDAHALADELGTGAAERSALVLGNGGAALAAVVACRETGAGKVYVTARKFSAEMATQSWPMASPLKALGAELLAWNSATLTPAVQRAAFVVQATSAGMKGADSGDELNRVLPWSALPGDALLYDLVYNPPETPFLAQARALGLRASNGLGMLVGQAARAFSLWLGVTAPVAAMRQAAEDALYGAHSS
ncbi:MAG TPA: shikimate dehydrogenase [Polyangiaceae bacterium]|nr:shikimate dehydrogenase [Polyangiaceae bacterium]